MSIMNQCILCEAAIPGGSRVCPECGNPVKNIKHAHVWERAMASNNMSSGKSVKYICRSCGRQQTIRKFKYQRHEKV